MAFGEVSHSKQEQRPQQQGARDLQNAKNQDKSNNPRKGGKGKQIATLEKELKQLWQDRNYFRFKIIYLIVPVLATTLWFFELFDGGLITGLLTIFVVLPMRLLWVMLLPKPVKQFMLVEQKVVIRMPFETFLSYIFSIFNVDVAKAWKQVTYDIPMEGRRMERFDIGRKQKELDKLLK